MTKKSLEKCDVNIKKANRLQMYRLKDVFIESFVRKTDYELRAAYNADKDRSDASI